MSRRQKKQIIVTSKGVPSVECLPRDVLTSIYARLGVKKPAQVIDLDEHKKGRHLSTVVKRPE
jgi:hypothetical protein